MKNTSLKIYHILEYPGIIHSHTFFDILTLTLKFTATLLTLAKYSRRRLQKYVI